METEITRCFSPVTETVLVESKTALKKEKCRSDSHKAPGMGRELGRDTPSLVSFTPLGVEGDFHKFMEKYFTDPIIYLCQVYNEMIFSNLT